MAGPNSRASDAASQELFSLKKWHFSLAIVAAFVAPVSAYYSTLAAVNERIAKIELKTSEQYVKKEDFKQLIDKMDRVAEDVSTIKGYLQKK